MPDKRVKSKLRSPQIDSVTVLKPTGILLSNDEKSPNVVRLLLDLENNPDLKHESVAGAELDPNLAMLRTWQSERLRRTYADLLEDKRYQPACLFFLNDIYAPRDFSQRDHDIERLHDFLSRLLPPIMLALLTQVVELNRLTNALDQRLVSVLVGELGVKDEITAQLYAEGYRICDNYAERLRQIELTAHVLAQVGAGSRLLVVGAAMKMLRGPAQRADWVELYELLEHGYAAFKQMRDVKTFVGIIEQREKRILGQIFSGAPDPFAV